MSVGLSMLLVILFLCWKISASQRWCQNILAGYFHKKCSHILQEIFEKFDIRIPYNCLMLKHFQIRVVWRLNPGRNRTVYAGGFACDFHRTLLPRILLCKKFSISIWVKGGVCSPLVAESWAELRGSSSKRSSGRFLRALQLASHFMTHFWSRSYCESVSYIEDDPS